MIGCTGVAPVKTKYITPSDVWLVETPLPDEPVTRGDLKNRAFPEAIKNLKDCNADKAAIRKWKATVINKKPR